MTASVPKRVGSFESPLTARAGPYMYLRIGQGRAFKVSDKNVAFQENVRQDNRDTEFGELG